MIPMVLGRKPRCQRPSSDLDHATPTGPAALPGPGDLSFSVPSLSTHHAELANHNGPPDLQRADTLFNLPAEPARLLPPCLLTMLVTAM